MSDLITLINEVWVSLCCLFWSTWSVYENVPWLTSIFPSSSSLHYPIVATFIISRYQLKNSEMLDVTFEFWWIYFSQKSVFFKKKTDFWEIKIQLNSKGHPKSLGALKLLTDIGWSAQKFNADCCLIGTDIYKYLFQYFLIIKIMLSVHQMKEWDHEIRREDEKPIEIVF